MIRNFIRSVAAWMRRVLTKPRDELDRWQSAARFAYDLSRYGGRQLRRDRAPQMAAALAFRTLFALAPVLIVSMIVVKSVRGTDGFLELANGVFAALDLDKVSISPPDGAAVGDEPMPLSDWLLGLIKQAAGVNVAAVGWLGVGMIAYAAIGLLVTIENAFNTVFHAPHGRPWTRRLPVYWFVLTASPIAIGVAWYVDQHVEAWIDSVVAWQTLLTIAATAWRLFVGWAVLLAVYALLPNTNVRLRTAAVGALASACLLEVGGKFVGASLQNMFSLSQLYGSLGTVPLFMFWVYLMWLVVLFGLQVAATLQSLHGRELDEIETKSTAVGVIDPASVVSVMEVVAERFTTGAPTSAQHVAQECLMSEHTVARVFAQLVDSSVLHWVDVDAKTVALARPADKISAEELVDAGYQLIDQQGTTRPSHFVEKLRDAQRRLAAETTLASLTTTS